MEKFYRLLEWLTMEQALIWLRTMTNEQLTKGDLLQLCDVSQCAVYLDCHGLKGSAAIDTGEEIPAYEPVNGRGVCKVEYPLQLIDESRHGIHVIGSAWADYSGGVIEDCEWWVPVEQGTPAPLFKNTDIQVLADTMNSIVKQSSATELENLRKQLAVMQRNLDDVEARRETLHLRCSYTHQLLENSQTENAQLRDLLADSDAKLKLQIIERSEIEMPAIGLTFPYATKHLEAMRDAALEHWSRHDRAKPAPYGIQKTVHNFLAKRTGENARKVAELAAAIKPDDLPKS